MARSIAEVHRRNPWTGRCRACRDRHPCLDRRDADTVLGATDHARLGLVVVVGTVVPVLIGVLLVAATAVGWVR